MKRAMWLLAVAALLGNIESAKAAPILSNPGFETGSLSPWFQGRDFGGSVNWQVTNTDAHSGIFSAMDNGNKELKQTFSAVPTSLITQVSFWAKHPDPNVRALAVDFFYTDGTDQEFQVSTTGTGWNFFDVTSDLASGKQLNGFSIFGNSAGVTFVDDFAINANVPEPATLAVFGALAVGAFGVRRRMKVTKTA